MVTDFTPGEAETSIDFKRQNIKIISITPVEGRGSLRAFVNLQVGFFIIHDCRIIQELG
jgi:hypothetical protein